MVALPFLQTIEVGAELIEGIPYLRSPTQELRDVVSEGEVGRTREEWVSGGTQSSFVAQH
jgi:hypothetical protein